MSGALAIAAGVFLMAPSVADAAFPGRNGSVVFVESEPIAGQNLSPDWELFTLHAARRARGGVDDRVLRDCGTTDYRSLCPLADASYRGDGRRLVLSVGVAQEPTTQATRRRQLAIGRSDASRLAVLPPLTEADRQPALSRWGGRIAFVGAVGGARELFTVAANGQGLRRLTFSAAREESPVWSSRGRLAYVRGGNLFLLSRDGRRARRLTRRGARSPDWSPDGRRIVFVRNGNLYIMRARDGRGLRRLTRRGATEPAWSPDGRRIAFRRRFDVYTMSSRGRSVRRLYNWVNDGESIPPARFAPRNLTWQPLPR